MDLYGYGIGFDSHSEISLPHGSMGKNVILIGAVMSSSVHVDNKGKDIYTIRKNICKVYTIMEATVSYLLMLQRYINSKQKTQK